jgi:hypothetical protein
VVPNVSGAYISAARVGGITKSSYAPVEAEPPTTAGLPSSPSALRQEPTSQPAC